MALLALGSSAHLHRADGFSDLDFFVVASHSAREELINDLSWLDADSPLVWSYRNTSDGCRALSADGLLYEFAVFTPDGVKCVPFAPGRVVWRRPGFDTEQLRPSIVLPARSHDICWLTNEAISNLYCGLARYSRGEWTAAFRLVQVIAVDRVLDLASALGLADESDRDPFAPERRVERRMPAQREALCAMMPGIGHTPAAARAVLEWLTAHVPLSDPMQRLIAALPWPEHTCPGLRGA